MLAILSDGAQAEIVPEIFNGELTDRYIVSTDTLTFCIEQDITGEWVSDDMGIDPEMVKQVGELINRL